MAVLDTIIEGTVSLFLCPIDQTLDKLRLDPGFKINHFGMNKKIYSFNIALTVCFFFKVKDNIELHVYAKHYACKHKTNPHRDGN